MNDCHYAPSDAKPELIDRLIGAAGADPADRVAIAGGRVDLLIGVLRRGFADALCIGAEAPAGSEDFEIVLIPDAAPTAQLCKALPRLLRRLHPGGTAVLRQPPGGSIRGRRALRRALQDCGLVPLGEQSSADGVLMIARKPATARLAQVA
jgi:hypothetical protein